MLESAKREWRSFKEAEAGERFEKHYRRAHRSASVAARVVRIVIGAVLIAGGVFLLFVPGPGLLVMLFGVALLAGESRWLAERMDRAELGARTRWRRARRWIRRRRAHETS